jgi:hypothetical protein
MKRSGLKNPPGGMWLVRSAVDPLVRSWQANYVVDGHHSDRV